MKFKLSLAIGGILLLCSLLCSLSIGDETQGYLILMQGGNSTLIEGPEGRMILTIQDVVPYASQIKNFGYIKPISMILNDINGSVGAAIVLGKPDRISSSMVQILNPVYSEKSRTLSLDIHPLEFYDGTILSQYQENPENVTPELAKQAIVTRLFIEIPKPVPGNDINMNCFNSCVERECSCKATVCHKIKSDDQCRTDCYIDQCSD